MQVVNEAGPLGRPSFLQIPGQVSADSVQEEQGEEEDVLEDPA